MTYRQYHNLSGLARSRKPPDTVRMNRRTASFRTAALPVALMGLAVALPWGVSARPAAALPAEATVRLAESHKTGWPASLTTAAKNFCGAKHHVALATVLPVRHEALNLRPVEILPTDRAVSLASSPPLGSLCDLPPPIDCG